MQSFGKIKPTGIGNIMLSITDKGKLCPVRDFLRRKCLLTLFANIKFSRKLLNLQYSTQHHCKDHNQFYSLCKPKFRCQIPKILLLKVWHKFCESAFQSPIWWSYPMPCSSFCKRDTETWDLSSIQYPCVDTESFARGSPTLKFFFSLMSGGRIQKPLLAGHKRPASETPFKWCFAGGPMMARHWMLVALWF